MIRVRAVLVAVLLFSAIPNQLDAAAMSVDPLALYGPEIKFDVYLNGSKSGHHTARFSVADDGALRVATELNLKVTFLGLTVYRYLYQSKASWRDGRLEDIKSEVDDDGEVFSMAATRQGDAYLIARPDGMETWRATLFPSNHWHAGVLKQSNVLNTLDGKVSSVRIEPKGVDKIMVAGREIEATRYLYTGDFTTTVWYDDLGRWKKMRFPAKDGAIIEYRCVSCGAGIAPAKG